MEYTDIHCHILSDADDGAESDDEMYEMLRLAYESGTRSLCCTPHFNPGFYGENNRRVNTAYEKLTEYAQVHYPDMRLYLGNELMYYNDCLDDLGTGKCRTLNGTRYVLTDFLVARTFEPVAEAMRKLLMGGYIPIFAHAERYPCCRAPFGEIEELKANGVLIQINSTSVTGGFGKHIQKKAFGLLKRHIPDIVASDAHGTHTRHPGLDEAYGIISDKFGTGYAKALLAANPEAILNGKMR